MRRPSLSTKLFAAALPLVLAIAALLALTVRSDLSDVRSAENGAELGAVWDPLITALTAIEAEAGQAAGLTNTDVPVDATRGGTDQAIDDLRVDIDSLGASDAANAHITASSEALSAARGNLDAGSVSPDLRSGSNPFESYDLASRELVAVGQLLPSEAGDATLGRELLAVVKLAEAKLSANAVIAGTQRWQDNPSDISYLATARSAFSEMDATLGEFEAIAPEEWVADYRQSPFPTELDRYRAELDNAMRAAQAGEPASFDTASFSGLVSQGVAFQSVISQEIVDRASVEAEAARRTTLIRIGISLCAVLLAALIALFITRSITRRIKAVSASANQVAGEQLPALVEALRDPRGKSVVPEIQMVSTKGNDELAELASAFNSMQSTLVDVAHEQVEVLRRGVSDIFITMARRNRSLIDRQLAMLDEFEAEVDDPDVLSNYYQLDHLATRMRRNSESLLVLASAEPKRRRVKATEIDDVVRASIGEVEEYRRVEIEHLESLQVRGTVVADVSHLIAELLDNATAFSPPESPVRVGGRRAGDSYLLRIVDSGIGIPTERLRDLNELLREPPIVGLSVESTLGMSVVSLLAHKHGIKVTLSAGNPGLTVDISLPSALFGPIDVPSERPGGAMLSMNVAAAEEEQIVSWNDQALLNVGGLSVDEAFEPVADHNGYAEPRAHTAAVEPDEDRPVAASDWTRMSLSLSAFQTGQKSAAATTVDEPETPAVADFVPADATPGTEQAGADSTEAAIPADATPETEPTAEDPTEAFVLADPTPETETEAFVPIRATAETKPTAEDPTEAFVPIDPTPETKPTAEDPTEAFVPIHATAETEPIAWGLVTSDVESSFDVHHSDAATTETEAEQVDVLAVAEPVLSMRSETAAPSMLHLPPPPPTARVHGEFDTPLAPPMMPGGPSRLPVTPATARSVPVRPPAETPATSPGLPTRSPSRGPDGGPDRLLDAPAERDADSAAPSNVPSALQSALSAFDVGRNGSNGTLPNRTRVGDPVELIEEPAAAAASRLDPDALRQRLRAFQTEFHTGVGDEFDPDGAVTTSSNDHNSDLGGDLR